MSASDLLTVKGYVQLLPAAPGSEDAARVAVISEDGAEYPILHKGEGVALLKNINANVEVTGRFAEYSDEAAGEEADTVRVLVVKSFRLTDGYDDPWYDDAVG